MPKNTGDPEDRGVPLVEAARRFRVSEGRVQAWLQRGAVDAQFLRHVVGSVTAASMRTVRLVEASKSVQNDNLLSLRKRTPSEYA